MALWSRGLQISKGETVRHLPPEGLIYPSLGAAWSAGRQPEILIVCPNPDQLLQVVSTLVALIERIWDENTPDDERQLPAIILSANGIYFQRVRQIFIEKLEESILMGRLPDLWPDHMPIIVGHLLRGVTFQTGIRQGTGGETIYYPGARGISVLAGGSEAVRHRCATLLSQLGGWFDESPKVSPTRLEFEKAIANLTSNLLGLIYAFDDEGNFAPLTVGDILLPERETDVRELVLRVVEVGRVVKVFAPTEDAEAVFQHVRERMRSVQGHVPSSLQSIGLQIKAGCLEPAFPPTETWLVEPLVRYARSGGLTEAVDYFEGLRHTLVAKLEKAAAKAKP